jgi:CDP-diacylglycerol--glycerol-3-phosphate 3-phosphatidyltransferase
MLMLNINDVQYPQSQRGLFRYIATTIFLTIAVGDAIDGYLARRKKQVTKLGAFLDPLADKLLMTCACLLLASKRAMVPGFRMPIEVVVIIIAKDMFLLIGFIVVFMFTQVVHVLPVRIGKVATAMQLIMVAAVLLAPEMSSFIPYYIWFLRVLWWSAAGTAILATAIYIRTGSGYIEEVEKADGAK